MKPANNHQLFLLDTGKTYADRLPFFMQPIIGSQDGLVFGFEILYRGGMPRDWTAIDGSVMDHLCDAPAGTLPTFFVNICNQALLDIAPERFVEAARRHQVYFELSEAQADAGTWHSISAKIHALAAQGVQFAHDDYGSIKDNLPRVFSLDCISVIKVDSTLLSSAMQSQSAADALRSLLAHWRQAGIASIAECIETPAMMGFARHMQFDYVQGFHVDAMLSGLDSRDLNHAA